MIMMMMNDLKKVDTEFSLQNYDEKNMMRINDLKER